MGKSIKLKNDIYWDSSSIVHNKTSLKNIIDNKRKDDLYFGVGQNSGKYFKLFSFSVGVWTNSFCQFSVVACNNGWGYGECAIGIYGDNEYLGSGSRLYIKGQGRVDANSIVAYLNGNTITVYWLAPDNWTYVAFKLNMFNRTIFSLGDGNCVTSVSGTKLNTVYN